jgi:SAM-dependent methyltransferase
MASRENTAGEVEFDVPAHLRRGALHADQRASVDNAVDILSWLASELGLPDLANTSMLDIGCGVKFTQALYGRRIPIKRYHGVEVDQRLIDFLAGNVKDPKFSYKFIAIYNARYHRRGGKPLSAQVDIGVPGQTFDLVCLFSVFTHLAPPDFRAMLNLARKYVAADGTLVFTAFIDDTIEGDFVDLDPARPLFKAVYRERAIREFVEAANWSVTRIFRPGSRQHRIVCRPV